MVFVVRSIFVSLFKNWLREGKKGYKKKISATKKDTTCANFFFVSFLVSLLRKVYTIDGCYLYLFFALQRKDPNSKKNTKCANLFFVSCETFLFRKVYIIDGCYLYLFFALQKKDTKKISATKMFHIKIIKCGGFFLLALYKNQQMRSICW